MGFFVFRDSDYAAITQWIPENQTYSSSWYFFASAEPHQCVIKHHLLVKWSGNWICESVLAPTRRISYSIDLHHLAWQRKKIATSECESLLLMNMMSNTLWKRKVTCSFPQRQPGISSPNFTLKTIDLKKVLRILFVDDILVDNKIFF